MSSNKLLVKIIENWPAKVLSIALALLLFVFHRMSTMASRPISVPLAIETSSTMIPASSYPQNVRLQLRGEDNAIRSIADGDIEAFVDFTRHEAEGLYRAPVQIRKKGTALNVEPLEISVDPLEVSIHLDFRIVKPLPLKADIYGTVASGFDFLSYSISPAEIVVSGPLSILENVMEIKTDSINLSGRSGDFNLLVNIINPNPYLVIRGSEVAEFYGQIRLSGLQHNEEDIPLGE